MTVPRVGWMAEDHDITDRDEQAVVYDFRPFVHGDMIMLARWLREPVVAAWWRDPVRQLALLQEDLSNPAMEQVIVLADGAPIAFARICEVHSRNAPHLSDQPRGALGVDCFAAPEGLGHGKAWLRHLGDLLLQGAPVILADPEFGNLRAISAYQGAGYTGTGMRLNGEGRTARILTRHR